MMQKGESEVLPGYAVRTINVHNQQNQSAPSKHPSTIYEKLVDGRRWKDSEHFSILTRVVDAKMIEMCPSSFRLRQAGAPL